MSDTATAMSNKNAGDDQPPAKQAKVTAAPANDANDAAMPDIRVAIVGVGNCAKSLVEGVQYYVENPHDQVGLMYPDIGGYTAKHLKFVVGFDIDERKCGRSLAEALRAKPNCAMDHVPEITETSVPAAARVHRGPTLDGIAPHMTQYPVDTTFKESGDKPVTLDEATEILQREKVDVVINYLPVGSHEASAFYVDAAVRARCHFVNCIPTFISTKEAKALEQRFIDAGLTIVGSDMRSAWGASRVSEVLQGAMLDSGLMVTQHIQMNMAAGTTQGHETQRTGRTANTDFLNMAKQDRLHSKHVSKENVLKGQNVVRDTSTAGMTLFAGPSLTVQQKPGGTYLGSDNKVANFDIVAYGFGGARYELTARLSVQDSPNSGGVVVSAIRFCKVAAELGIVGFLRGASAWTQKTPPLQMRTGDAKFECDALSRRQLTDLTRAQLKENTPVADTLPYTFQSDTLDYE
ncbi:myo-inositol-1-phosphate synthase [Salpingoeca rosetta]|uniref:Myo-inositol-1-phosphate synthase n=1 Tax=Salpingoeca rosetta (strain ATCC 50818 / BSB-021) TaxID=946362 RepID=F2U7N0_SALR5|nr:myo-inositol-1-phosphate synthase [Salpingoeca rosetta]EGD83447.1 myo-inositol-1-phosphate synthase [Salpingoeca rosetta]|eukprot:XP_004994951.1 myo-inositol-1-phosphate synthase [Salpingoeca rosetta]